MEEKKKDLNSTKQKKIIETIMLKLSDTHPSYYYLPTIELAALISEYIKQPGNLNRHDLELVQDLSKQDIQLILSFHSS